MSSKRGRKRNDNLPPNRARDVQRAFRARRAAHLQALEYRVSELQEENDYLRHALNLPPSNRPPLGRGPTGKDKPASPRRASNASPFTSSRGSSSNADSPPSRQTSVSPSGVTTVSMSPSRPGMTLIEGAAWDDSDMLRDHSQLDNPSPDTSYQMPSIVTPSVSPKDPQNSSYSNAIASSSHHPSTYYAHATHPTTNYSQVSNIPGADFTAPNYSIRSEFREENTSRPYSYTSESYPSNNSVMEYSGPPASGDFHHSQTPHTQSLDPARHLHHPQPSRHAQVFPDRDHRQDISLVQVRGQGVTNSYTDDQGPPHPPNLGLHGTRTHVMEYTPRTQVSAFAAVPHMPYAPDNGRPRM